ncbi:hypothetical protein DE40_23090, partial [Salmonella enterica subsp. enterica serovar London]
ILTFLFIGDEKTFKKVKQSAGGNNDVGHKYEVFMVFLTIIIVVLFIRKYMAVYYYLCTLCYVKH